MRIGIGCRTILNPTLGEGAGVGHYTYFLVKHLLDIDHDNEYVLFFDSRMQDTAEFQKPNVTVRHFPFYQYKKFLPFSYSHMLITALLLKERLDVFHTPGGMLPLTYPKKSIVTIHDLAIYKNPAWFPDQIISTKLLVPQMIRNASHLIAVSKSTREDLRDIFNVPSGKMSIVHEAPFVTPINLKDKNTDVLKKFRLHLPYVLFIGTLEPRKNLENLILAFEHLKKHRGHGDVQLVIAGGIGYRHEPILEKLNTPKYKQCIRYLGYITHNEKLGLLRSASVFAYPSLYEGFGLPVLEAMSMGVPVVTSSVSSLPEIGGNAVLYADPEKPSEIARAISRILLNPHVAQEMAKRGRQQASRFTWEQTARDTLAVYERVGRTKVEKGKKQENGERSGKAAAPAKRLGFKFPRLRSFARKKGKRKK